jgi:transcriptional antiterminator
MNSAVYVLPSEQENNVSWRKPTHVTRIHVKMAEHVGNLIWEHSSVCVVRDTKEMFVKTLLIHVNPTPVRTEENVSLRNQIINANVWITSMEPIVSFQPLGLENCPI